MTPGWPAGHTVPPTPWPGVPATNPNPEVRSRAMTAFMLSAFFTALCCGVAVLPALICSGLALGRADLQPDSARELTKWSFIALGVGVALMAVGITLIAVLGSSDIGQEPQ